LDMTKATEPSVEFKVGELATQLTKAQAYYDRQHLVTEAFDHFIRVADGEVPATIRAGLDRIRRVLDSEVVRAEQHIRNIEALVASSPDVAKVACMPLAAGATFTILGARLLVAIGVAPTDYGDADVVLETLRTIIHDTSTPEIRVEYARELHDESSGVFRYALAEAQRLREPVVRSVRNPKRKAL
jgi:hypothetical protein